MATCSSLTLVAIDVSGGILDFAMYSKAMFTIGEIEVTSVKQFVSAVLARTAGGQKIQTLWVHGHGQAGYQGMGSSHDMDPTGEKGLLADVNGDLVGDGGKELPKLANSFTPDGCICLSGCNTGYGVEGKRLLKAVSRALGGKLYVMAADAVQYALLPGFEGNVICCNEAVCWIKKGDTWVPK